MPCTTWPRFLGNVAERASRRLCTCYNTETGYNGRVRTQAFLGRRLKLPPHAAIRPSSRGRVAQRPDHRIRTSCSANPCITAIAFASAHLLTGPWSQRLAPLGQTVFGTSCGCSTQCRCTPRSANTGFAMVFASAPIGGVALEGKALGDAEYANRSSCFGNAVRSPTQWACGRCSAKTRISVVGEWVKPTPRGSELGGTAVSHFAELPWQRHDVLRNGFA